MIFDGTHLFLTQLNDSWQLGSIEICNFFSNEPIFEQLKKRKTDEIGSDFSLPACNPTNKEIAVPQPDVTSRDWGRDRMCPRKNGSCTMQDFLFKPLKVSHGELRFPGFYRRDQRIEDRKMFSCVFVWPLIFPSKKPVVPQLPALLLFWQQTPPSGHRGVTMNQVRASTACTEWSAEDTLSK